MPEAIIKSNHCEAEISIVVPCYNSEKTLGRCLDSLLAQTIPVKIIVMNDGSTDHTLEIAKHYADHNRNIRVVTQNNCGLPQTRKKGLSRVETKYTAFVDSDDWVEPEMMKTLYDISERYHASISVCEIIYERRNKSKPGTCDVRGEICVDGKTALHMLHMRRGVHPMMWNKLFLTETAYTLEFPTGNFLGEDYCTLVPWLENIDCVAITDRPLYHYVLNDVSMSRNGFGPAHQTGYEKYTTVYSSYSKNHPTHLCETMASYLCVEYAAIYVAMIRNGNYDWQIIQNIRTFLRQHLKHYLKQKNPLNYFVSVPLIAYHPVLFQKLYSLYMRFV